MIGSPFDPATLRYYADEAPDYVASGPEGRSRYLDVFLDRLAPGASVLELGCGGGRDTEHMIRRGYSVDPTDGVEEMAAKAEARLGRPVRVMRFDQLNADHAYDAVWAHASLLHVPRGSLPEVLGAIWRALKPGGWHFANFKGGGTEGRDEFGRYFSYMSAEQIQVAYVASGRWDVAECFEYQGGGYDKRLGPWTAITVRKTMG